MFKKLSEAAVREGMKLLGDPRVMKLMSSPKVMGVMMQAMQLRTVVQGAIDRGGKEIAHRFHLVTEEEASEMRSRISELEEQIDELHDTQAAD